MMPTVHLDWHGPYSVSEVAVGKFEDAQEPGCYVWYLPKGTDQQPYYVGQTGNKLKSRLQGHCCDQLSGQYGCFDTEMLKAGDHWRKALVYRWNSDADFLRFIKNWKEFGRRAYETLLVSTFYTAIVKPSLCRAVEATLMRRYEINGFVLSNIRRSVNEGAIELICTGDPQVCKDLTSPLLTA